MDATILLSDVFIYRKPIERDASGNYVIDGKTISQDMLLFIAAEKFGIVDSVVVFNAWESNPYIDYRSDDFYNDYVKTSWAFNPPSFGFTKETEFYASALKEGPAKSKDAWKAFASKFFPDVNKSNVNATVVDLPLPAVMQQTWWTHRPEGDESHLLNWYEPISDENLQRVIQAAKDSGIPDADIDDLRKSVQTGGDAYVWLGMYFQKNRGLSKNEAKKAASEALYAHDIDGVKYPVGVFHNPTNRDGRLGWNYVAFSDEHLRVDHVYVWNAEGSHPRVDRGAAVV